MRTPTLLLTLALLLTACDVVPRDAEGQLTEATELRFDAMRVGDCFDDPDPTEVRTNADGEASVFSLPGVPCADPHDNEVYAILEYPEAADAPWPGSPYLYEQGLDICYDAFEVYVGASYQESRLDFELYYPAQESWERIGDRELVCYLYDYEFAKLTGTMRASRE